MAGNAVDLQHEILDVLNGYAAEMNTAEIIGVLECIKLDLFKIAVDAIDAAAEKEA